MEQAIGEITHFFDKISVAVVKITKGSIKVGETVKIKGGDRDVEMTVESMQVEHKAVPKAKKGDEVGLKVPQKVREGDLVYFS